MWARRVRTLLQRGPSRVGGRARTLSDERNLFAVLQRRSSGSLLQCCRRKVHPDSDLRRPRRALTVSATPAALTPPPTNPKSHPKRHYELRPIDTMSLAPLLLTHQAGTLVQSARPSLPPPGPTRPRCPRHHHRRGRRGKVRRQERCRRQARGGC